MLEDLLAAVSRRGLSMHTGKTKVLTNQIAAGKLLRFSGKSIDILAPEESTMYLGRRFSLHSLHDTELDNRIQQAWRKFWAHKSELCGVGFRLKDRLRLFDSIITASVLYSCGTWTMTVERARKLRTAQRTMLRKIINTKRKLITDTDGSFSSTCSSAGSHVNEDADEDADDGAKLEPWVEWIKRATRLAEVRADLGGIPDWVTEQTRRKYRLAGHVSRRNDGRWSAKVLCWSPEGGTRKRGRPERRWTDEFDTFFGALLQTRPGQWREIAADRETWKSFEEEFLSFCLKA
jgi:hypothetical protein